MTSDKPRPWAITVAYGLVITFMFAHAIIALAVPRRRHR